MARPRKTNPVIFFLIALCIFEALVILLLWGRPRIRPRPSPAIKGRIAIVLDDWGYNDNNLGVLSRISAPLTLAVLPHLPYSRTIGKEAAALGKEVILHLPMEPRERYRLEENTIMASMTDEEIRRIINNDIDSIDNIDGVSNHMGSRVTEDNRTMTIILSDLKRRNVYFFDSMVSAGSIGEKLAGDLRVRTAKRDIFIDNEQDPASIRAQLVKLKERARRNGSAIGIGHDRTATLEVLREVIPDMEREGYSFVKLSQLVR